VPKAHSITSRTFKNIMILSQVALNNWSWRVIIVSKRELSLTIDLTITNSILSLDSAAQENCQQVK